jgi:adenine-specific DNA-methyltransferase
VLLDDVFGRSNYLSTMFVQVRYAQKTLTQDMVFHKQVEQIHIYRKSYGAKPNLNTIKSSFDKFNFYIKEKSAGTEMQLGNKKVIVFQPNEYLISQSEGSTDGLKEIWATGTILDGNSSGRFFRDYLTGRYKIDGLGVLYKVYGIGDDKFNYRYFTGPKKIGATKGKYFQGVPLEQLENPDELKNLPIENFVDLAGEFGNCRLEGGVNFRAGKKPEALLKIILDHFSNEDDLVLDSFLGSGTTAAVAHKMGRRYIGIEMGEQAKTHCVVRLQKVIDGDKTGISKSVGWTGGGGFRFYTLGDTIFDEAGKIRDAITFDQLSAYLWFYETKTPFNKPPVKSTVLGVHHNVAYALLYNGILHDKRVDGGNVLTAKTLAVIRAELGKADYEKLVIYGEASRIGISRLKELGIEFKQTPYDVRIE